MPSVESKTTIAAPPADALRALRTGLPGLAAHIDGIEEIQVVDSGGDRTVATWLGQAQTPFGGPLKFRWTEEETWDEAAGTCTFAQTEGDFDDYHGSWTFAPAADGCALILAIEFAKEVGGLGPIVENLLQGKVQELADALVKAVKQLAEGG